MKKWNEMRNGKEAEIEVKGEVGKTNETEWNFKQSRAKCKLGNPGIKVSMNRALKNWIVNL